MPLIGHPPLEKPSLCFRLLCVARQVRWPSSPLPRDVPRCPALSGVSLCKEAPVARGGLEVELGEGEEEGKKMPTPRPCLLQDQPQAVGKGQPPSVPFWDSTSFSPQGSGLEDQFTS